MNYILSLVTLAILSLASGCATKPDEMAQKSAPTATCLVCRYNNDLACVDVRVKASTPRAEYRGTTYYFCSDDCRAAFLKNPEKYLLK